MARRLFTVLTILLVALWLAMAARWGRSFLSQPLQEMGESAWVLVLLGVVASPVFALLFGWWRHGERFLRLGTLPVLGFTAFVVGGEVLASPCAAVVPVAVAPFLTWYFLRPVPRLHAGGLCSNCGYDLRATPGRCPECGAVPAAKQA